MLLCFSISDVFSHNYKKSKINSDDDLPSEKTLNMHNALCNAYLVCFNENYIYYYQVFLEKCSYKLIK